MGTIDLGSLRLTTGDWSASFVFVRPGSPLGLLTLRQGNHFHNVRLDLDKGIALDPFLGVDRELVRGLTKRISALAQK